jgi:GR25 family glycosyltransferase involved in LPS biosynthesis
MIPSFVIHNSSSKDRDLFVDALLKQTRATVFEAIMTPKGVDGCRQSHINVAKLAKQLHPTSHYIVFEDDCILSENWQEILKGYEFADVLYLGYNDRCSKAVFGTHALYLSPKARDVIIEGAERYKDCVENKGAYDWILSLLCRKYGLITCMPKMENRELFCHQAKDVVSLITGQTRK